MAAGTTSYSKYVPITGGVKLRMLKITAPNAGAGQTSFTISIDGTNTGDIVHLNPTSATARALTSIGGTISSAGTLTVTLASATLDGSETFDVTIWSVR